VGNFCNCLDKIGARRNPAAALRPEFPMPLEIERKFLVTSDAWRGAGTAHAIRQGYLTTSDITTVRIRIDGPRAYITVKGECGGPTRSEYEYEIPLAHADEMLRLCHKPLIEKTRHDIPFEGQLWQVDVFTGDNDGLVLAEAELTHPHQHLVLPPWIGLEVTRDVRYRNSYLARHPFSAWRTAAA
jgi:adenylate cyclase